MAIRLGFIGTGWIGKTHMANVAGMKDVEIAAVCDVVKQKADDAAAEFGGTPYRDYRQMLAGEKLHGVYISVIPAAHARIETDVIAAGRPFYIEKPIHLDLGAAKQIARAAAKKRLITGVGYHWRYDAATQKAMNFVKGRQPSIVRGQWMGGMPGVDWWRQQRLSGGQALEQTTHIFDLARYLFGEVKEVFAYAARGLMTDVPKYSVDDSSTVSMKFASGAIGTIESSCVADDSGFGSSGLNALGKGWAFRMQPNELTTWQKGVKTEVDCRGAAGNAIEPGDAAFVHALKTRDRSKLLSDYADGVKSLAVGLAANESIRTGKPIKVRA